METLWCLLILSSLLASIRAASISDGLTSIVNDIKLARSASYCAQVSARLLFSPTNDLSIIGSNNSSPSSAIVQKLLRETFPGRSMKIFTNFSKSSANLLWNLAAKDSSFLVIDGAPNLRRLMSESSAERWAEYVIVVVQETTGWLDEFADYLLNLGFFNVAFVSVTADGRSTLVQPVKDPKSPISTTTMKMFDVCVPNNQADPISPENPIISKNPTNAVNLINPANLTNLAKPTKLVSITNPVKSTNLASTTTPAKPTNLVSTTTPAKPRTLVSSTTPAIPTNLVNTTNSAKSTNLASAPNPADPKNPISLTNPAIQMNPSTIRPFSSFHPDNISNRTLSFARILEGTEDPNEFATIKDGKTTSFGVDILRTIADRYNISLVRYEWPNQSESSWTEAMQRCLAGEFDYFYAVLPSIRHVTKGDVSDIEAVAWYKYEFLTFVDTPKRPALELTDILIPYHGEVWVCAFGLFGAFAGFAYAIDRFWQRGLIRERITVLTIWSIFVDQSLPALPVKFGLRFVIGMWVFHNFLRNAGYTALFSSALTAVDDRYVLKTFEDILQSGKPICGSRKVKQLLNNSDDEVIKGIYERFKVVHPRAVLDAVINQSCIGTRHLSFVERHNMMNRGNASRLLYTVNEAIIIKYPSFYFSKKRNRFNNEFREAIARAYEVGVISWVGQKYSLQVDKSIGVMPVWTKDSNLRLTHLLIVFQLLFVGHFIALVVFVAEIYAHTRSAKRLGETKS